MMKYLMAEIEKGIKLTDKEISKIELEMSRLDGRLEEHKDRRVMLEGLLKAAEDAERLANIPAETEGEEK